MDKFDANRRKLLALGGVALGAAILPTPAFATLSTPRPRILTLNNLHTGESIKAEFFDGRGYIQEELAKLNHFFRDYRANKIKSIDPGLFDQLYRLQGLLGTRKPVQLISGYRSIDTNNELRARSRGVAKKSYHTKGQATEKSFPSDKVPFSTTYAVMLRFNRRISCVQVTPRISVSLFAFCSRRSVSNRTCVRKAICEDSFACIFSFAARVPVSTDEISIMKNVTGYPTAYVSKDILGSIRKKQNKNTLKKEPATLQR